MAATFQHVAYHKAKSGNEDEKTECNTLFNYIAICHLFDAEVKKRGSTTNSTEWHIWSGEMKNKLKVNKWDLMMSGPASLAVISFIKNWHKKLRLLVPRG